MGTILPDALYSSAHHDAQSARVLALYSLTVLASAFLLFGVQPIAGRMLLPVLGGVPGAWTACLLFFQCALLAGYAWGEALSRIASLRARIALHVALVIAPLAVLPPVVPDEASLGISPSTSPTLFALVFLGRSVGLPFFALSTTAPMLQSWLARTDHPASARPYFLYAASNAGSLGALLAYPFVVEPLLGLSSQRAAFGVGYAVLVVLVALCGAMTARRPRMVASAEVSPRPTNAQRARWVVLALVPSMLLASVTTYLSLDLAPIPLLWVLPLAAYLGTFVIAFRGGGTEMPRIVSRITRLLGVVLVVATLVHANSPLAVLVILHFAFFVLAALVAHGRLAKSAPAADHLTEFYVWMAVGGALGTFLTSVVATHLLPDLWEYPLAIAAACAVTTPWTTDERAATRTDGAWALAVLIVGLALVFAIDRSGLGELPFAALLVFGPLAIIAYHTSTRPMRYGLALAAMVLVGTTYTDHGTHLLDRRRGFFGILRTVEDASFRYLLHGSTLHGSQAIADRERCDPLAYYTRFGPLGRLLGARRAAFGGGDAALVGLGTGATACYAEAREHWRFFEINQDVVDVAEDARLFTFLRNARRGGADVTIDVADGRLGIAALRSSSEPLVILDAFNSDSVPIHLLTREAVQLYVRVLAPRGWLVLHCSNRTLDLTRVVAAIAEAEHLAAMVNGDAAEIAARIAVDGDRAGIPGTSGAPTWIVLARDRADLRSLDEAGFVPLPPSSGAAAWTDERASLFEVIRHR
jgi:hypothetical protein